MRGSLIVACLAVLLAGCAGQPASGVKASATASDAAAAASPADLYAASLHAVAVTGPAVIGPGLLRIAADNPDLVWRDGPAGRQVLVASTMSTSSYQKYYEGKPTGGPSGWGQIWVTAVPQLRGFCQAAAGDATAKTERVVQWLGLNPAVPYAQVVEMWIDPAQLARPCPLTDVTVSTCTLDDASTVSRPTCTAGDTACGERQSYWDWFSGNMRQNLKEGGAPWTRLGYTFDWKPKQGGGFERYGASEFILKPGAKYEVKAAYMLADYCASPGA
ncbi:MULTISPECIES: hypothetical protein [unclassified Azospirillum]|uniref:hypothetical protein n=1 Tax=unclassified Azospirillum TaxID=2630922 RepID=UPI000B6EA5F7|nr:MULTISPECIES: hypothetical protein [unclassified Azospirillum]SNS54242.1 hypothetical protein SAMN05880556_1072 [Azospirillum sp. RU38E]SNS73786.1 hypothetical protein SAMN05880591_1072 [Azospirillum sp. RU37A]